MTAVAEELFPHQALAFRQLLTTAHAFFECPWQQLPLRPRFNRLVIGPSGTGKTHLVRQMAAKLELPLMELCATNWMPLGAHDRGAHQTWLDIADFCFAHKRGIIFLDEIDKAGAHTPWMQHLRVEIFSLLDHCVPGILDWQPKKAEADDEFCENDLNRARYIIGSRLRDRILVIAAGAFQDLWQSFRVPAGFHSRTTATESLLPHSLLAEAIPVEIINRFVPPVLALPPLGDRDYRAILSSLCRRFPKPQRAKLRRLGKNSLSEAMQQQLGTRWAEQLVLELLTRCPKDHLCSDPE